MMGGHGEGLQTVHKTNTATGAAVITETASGASVAATETAPDRELPQETKEAISVDTTKDVYKRQEDTMLVITVEVVSDAA